MGSNGCFREEPPHTRGSSSGAPGAREAKEARRSHLPATTQSCPLTLVPWGSGIFWVVLRDFQETWPPPAHQAGALLQVAEVPSFTQLPSPGLSWFPWETAPPCYATLPMSSW